MENVNKQIWQYIILNVKCLATPSTKIIYQKLPYILLGFNILPVECFSIKHYTYLRSFGQLDLITITIVCWSSLYSLLQGEKAVRRDILLTAKGTIHFVLHVVIPWVTQLHVLLKIPQLSVSIFFLFTVSFLNSESLIKNCSRLCHSREYEKRI